MHTALAPTIGVDSIEWVNSSYIDCISNCTHLQAYSSIRIYLLYDITSEAVNMKFCSKKDEANYELFPTKKRGPDLVVTPAKLKKSSCKEVRPSEKRGQKRGA